MIGMECLRRSIPSAFYRNYRMTKGSNDINEIDLIRQVMNHDSHAMRIMYESYAGYLMGVCSRYVPESDDAKDILQDSFIKIFGKLDTFEPRGSGSLKAWVTRIVINEALGFLRKQKCLVALDHEESIADEVDEEEPEVDDLTADEIHRMIGELPIGYRTVFNLYVLEGKSHKEIAEMLGIAPDSSASQLSRAKRILAKKINEYRENRNHE